jgi:hypothetical protein
MTDGAASTTVRIRPTRAALLVVGLLAICALPLATAAWWLLWLLAVPALALAWVLRVGVDVDPAGITVRALLGRRRIGWADVAGLQASHRGDLWVVLAGGRRLRLPTARARHLPLIAAASGGRVPDPRAEPGPEADPAAGADAGSAAGRAGQ